MINKILENPKKKFIWIDIVHPSVEELESIAAEYSLHEMLVKDCLQPDHLPKIEKVENTLFIIVRYFDHESSSDADTVQKLTRKIAIFYSKNFLITIHRVEHDFFTSLCKTWSQANHGAVNLFSILCSILNYSLLTYEPFIDNASSLVLDIEDKIFLSKNSSSMIIELLSIKRKVYVLSRMFHLTIDILSRMEIPSEKNAPLIKDVRDTADRLYFYTVQLQENISNLLSLQISLSSLKTNEVMRVLTLFSVFFMPLTFIAGVYGMNFVFMPELKHQFGYPSVLLFMAFISLIIFIWFKKKKLL